MTTYKDISSYEHRFHESQRALDMGKIPIICERCHDSRLPELSNKKFVVAPTMTVRMFIRLLSERVAEEIEQPIYLFLGDSVLAAQKISMADLYRAHKESDSLIYVTYSSDKTNAARHMGAFQSTNTDAERKREADEALRTGMLPVVVERDEECALQELRDKRMIVDPTTTVKDFFATVAREACAHAPENVHLYAGPFAVHPCEEPMQALYDKFREKDGWLFVTYSDMPPSAATRYFPSSQAATPKKAAGRYRGDYTAAERRAQASEARRAGKIPVVCEVREGSRLPDLVNKKFVVQPEIRMQAFNSLVRSRTQTDARDTLFLFVGDFLLMADEVTAQDLYLTHRDLEDGILYLTFDNTDACARHMGVYKSTHTREYCRGEAARTLAGGSIPIIVERALGSQAREIVQKKFSTVLDMRVVEFAELLRTRITDETSHKVFIFADGVPVSPAGFKSTMEFYEYHKDDDDNLVYVTYSDKPAGSH